MSEKKKEGIDEYGNVLPGFPGHWRYRKDQKAKLARSGTTGMADFGKKKEVPKEKPKDKVDTNYNYDELKAMNKSRQVEIIKSYKGEDAEIPKYEDGKSGRIKLILKLQKK